MSVWLPSLADPHSVWFDGCDVILLMRNFKMWPRIFFCIQIILLAAFALPARQALAQVQDVGDQPGYLPDPADEELSPKLHRQLVYFRSNETPGTIVVQTSEKFLYVV